MDVVMAVVLAAVITHAWEQSKRHSAAAWMQARQRAQERHAGRDKARTARARARASRLRTAKTKGPRDWLWWAYAAGWVAAGTARAGVAAVQGAREGARTGAREGRRFGRTSAERGWRLRRAWQEYRRRRAGAGERSDETVAEQCPACGVYVTALVADRELVRVCEPCAEWRAAYANFNYDPSVVDAPPQAPWQRVRVVWPADSTIGDLYDSIRGWDREDALRNARRNWITETPYVSAARIEYLGPENPPVVPVPEDATRPCSHPNGCRGVLVPEGDVHCDEGDGVANVGLRCKDCGLASYHSWELSDTDYQAQFGHAFDDQVGSDDPDYDGAPAHRPLTQRVAQDAVAAMDAADAIVRRCPDCDGHGEVRDVDDWLAGVTTLKTCRTCGGSRHNPQLNGGNTMTAALPALGTGEGYSDTVTTLETLARQLGAAHETTQNLGDQLAASDLDNDTLAQINDLMDVLDVAAPLADRVAKHVRHRHEPVAAAVAEAGGSQNLANAPWYDDH